MSAGWQGNEFHVPITGRSDTYGDGADKRRALDAATVASTSLWARLRAALVFGLLTFVTGVAWQVESGWFVPLLLCSLGALTLLLAKEVTI